MDAIRTEALTKAFADVTAVDRLTLTVAEGELFGLVARMALARQRRCGC